MLHIPVTSIAPLLGMHRYKSSSEALSELQKKPTEHPIYDYTRELLRKTRFYDIYCNAPEITSILRVNARRVVDHICNKTGLRFRRPYAYFQKQRGIFQESVNTDRAEKAFNTSITDRQLKLLRAFGGFTVVGAIDGMDDDWVYEIKTRNSCLNVLEWEKVQLYFYCYMTGKGGRLVSFLGERHSVWECSLEEAQEFVNAHLDELRSVLETRKPAYSRAYTKWRPVSKCIIKT